MNGTDTNTLIFCSRRERDIRFHLNLRSVRLWKENTTEIKLPRQQMNLLLYFAQPENRQRLIRREELLEKFWGHQRNPDVSDGALSTAIGGLRKALGERHEGHAAFIETAHGQGYRFVALIEGGVEDTPPPVNILSNVLPNSAVTVPRPVARQDDGAQPGVAEGDPKSDSTLREYSSMALSNRIKEGIEEIENAVASSFDDWSHARAYEKLSLDLEMIGDPRADEMRKRAKERREAANLQEYFHDLLFP